MTEVIHCGTCLLNDELLFAAKYLDDKHEDKQSDAEIVQIGRSSQRTQFRLYQTCLFKSDCRDNKFKLNHVIIVKTYNANVGGLINCLLVLICLHFLVRQVIYAVSQNYLAMQYAGTCWLAIHNFRQLINALDLWRAGKNCTVHFAR